MNRDSAKISVLRQVNIEEMMILNQTLNSFNLKKKFPKINSSFLRFLCSYIIFCVIVSYKVLIYLRGWSGNSLPHIFLYRCCTYILTILSHVSTFDHIVTWQVITNWYRKMDFKNWDKMFYARVNYAHEYYNKCIFIF